MNTHTSSYLAKSIWVAALLMITWQQTTAAQTVVTQFHWRVEQPARRTTNPLPKGAHILILTNSPATNEAQRRYDQEVVVAAVQNCWFALLKNYDAPMDFAGTNVTEFELSFDGSVKRLVCVQKSGSKVLDMTSR